MDENPYHFPPDLLELTVRAVAYLVRGKQGVLDFFRGCGVPTRHLDPHREQLKIDKDGVRKATIAREVLASLNERDDATHLRARREVLKRIAQWEDFDTAWPSDRDAARGVVAAVRERIEKSDAFTRMSQEREQEREERATEGRARVAEAADRRARVDGVRTDLGVLFGSQMTPQRRGTALEGVLNGLFALDGVLVRDAFHRTESGIGTVEQIDGAIEVSGQLMLVEMKWHSERLGPDLVGTLLSSLFLRPDVVGGLFISASGYTKPALQQCREFLGNKLIVLSELSEFVTLLEREESVLDFLTVKRNAALLDKKPLVYPYRASTPA